MHTHTNVHRALLLCAEQLLLVCVCCMQVAEHLSLALLLGAHTQHHHHNTHADDIYRDDIVFRDPRNKFEGLRNYRIIFWSLRFHGKLFFSRLYVEVKRVWQPANDRQTIKMRWTVHGVPRVPWEAEGLFDGVSTYKLDSAGKIYEHAVDNVMLRDPPMALNSPLLATINLLRQPQAQPYPGGRAALCCMHAVCAVAVLCCVCVCVCVYVHALVCESAH